MKFLKQDKLMYMPLISFENSKQMMRKGGDSTRDMSLPGLVNENSFSRQVVAQPAKQLKSYKKHHLR